MKKGRAVCNALQMNLYGAAMSSSNIFVLFIRFLISAYNNDILQYFYIH